MSPWIVWPVCLVIFVVLYLASLGPVSALYSRGVISPEVGQRIVATVYFPIMWVGENTRILADNPIGQAYVAYVNWWVGETKQSF